jgi:hypothetical protein
MNWPEVKLHPTLGTAQGITQDQVVGSDVGTCDQCSGTRLDDTARAACRYICAGPDFRPSLNVVNTVELLKFKFQWGLAKALEGLIEYIGRQGLIKLGLPVSPNLFSSPFSVWCSDACDCRNCDATIRDLNKRLTSGFYYGEDKAPLSGVAKCR